MREDNQISADDFWRPFFGALATDGRIVFPPLADEHPTPPPTALLHRLESAHRLSFPGTAPDFDPQAASWAAFTVFHATRLIAERHREADELKAWLGDEFAPATDTGPAIYSVDLFLSCLPDLVSLASQKSEDDPLLEVLRALARRYPFSGLGIPELVPDEFRDSVVFTDASLLQAFTDRVMARGAWTWLGNPAVCACARETIGAHPEHFANLHARLPTNEPRPDS